MCVCFRMECQINLRRNCFGPKRKYKKENAISEAGIARDIELRSLMTFFQPFMSLLSRRKKTVGAGSRGKKETKLPDSGNSFSHMAPLLSVHLKRRRRRKKITKSCYIDNVFKQ